MNTCLQVLVITIIINIVYLRILLANNYIKKLDKIESIKYSNMANKLIYLKN